MTIVLYKMNASPPSRAVMATAEILKLDIETRELSIPNQENFKPEYLEKNPLHTIPLLEDEDFILADSHAIIIYFMTKYGNDKAAELYPVDVQRRAIVHQRLFLDASILFTRLITILRAIAFDNEPCVSEKQKADVEEAYGFLEKYLQKTSFVAGERFTIADISCVTTVSSLEIMVPIDDKYLKLKEWLRGLKSQDWYMNKNQPGVDDLTAFMDVCLQKHNK